jgi:hypothetical protein
MTISVLGVSASAGRLSTFQTTFLLSVQYFFKASYQPGSGIIRV